MGYLHEGHLSLVRRAGEENHHVGVSIFVNPAQFNNADDLQAYPRNLERDLDLLARENVDLVWTPLPEHVYPPSYQTYIEVEHLTRQLEGASRPGHFKGVVTIISKLLNIFQPDRVYFGQKDAQQVLVVKKMVRDLNYGVEVVVCPTIREPDGLAMSSRNARLSPHARKTATLLYHALSVAEAAYQSGECNAALLKSEMAALIASGRDTVLDYISVADPDTLEELDAISGRALISLAVVVEDVRLIDNITVNQI